MPLVKPTEGEKEQEFISRCMENKESNKKFPNQKQRAGVCFSLWKKSKKKKSKASEDSIEDIDIIILD